MIKWIISFFFIFNVQAYVCGGRFPNPITDICWPCLFPIKIGGISVTPFVSGDNFDPPPPLVCKCPMPNPPYVRLGVGVSFWEPARIAEVVKTPFCSPTLNGAVIGPSIGPVGTNFSADGGDLGTAFYHVHWIQYPVLTWAGLTIASGCLANETLDVAYMSELDPLWNDDEISFILNPEAILFTNPVAQAACAADSAKASTMGFGLDALFWCSGSQGSLYPLSGNHANHIGGIDSSLAIVHKMIFKLHRQLLAHDTSTPLAMCSSIPQPILRKNQYKQQMLYPIPQNIKGYGFGASSMLWGAGKEFPYKGEDFSYLIWRKRQCCYL